MQMDEITEGDVLVHRDGYVHVVTLNRPHRLNAVTMDMHHELERIFREVDHDPDSRAVLVTGAGRGFCAGGDLKAMQRGGRAGFSHSRPVVKSPGRDLFLTMLNMEKPCVAAVNGPAIGLGATIALSMDCIIMAEEACLGDTHIDAGLVAGDGGTILWPLLVGPHRAKEMLLTGRKVYGREAGEMGLVNHVVPGEKLLQTAMDLAGTLAAKAPWACRATKVAINFDLVQRATMLLEIAMSYEGHSSRKQDHKEALASFVEKRPAQFTGR
jgi:enoyl-CoA hydratase